MSAGFDRRGLASCSFHLLALVLLSLLLPTPAPAADPPANWPHWRGPHANGSVAKGNPPLKWDAKTNIRWKAPLPGKGSATPIVWGDRVFVLTAVDTGRKAAPADLPKPDPRFEKKTVPPDTYHQFLVLCFDRTTGKERWRKVAAEMVPHEGHHFSHSYAAGSPTTDGKRLYVSFGSFGLYCYDLDGKLLWQRDLGRLQTRLGWGEAVTPVVHGDTLVVNWDQEEGSFITALDSATGKPRWKTDRDEPTSWATPFIVEHKGVTQVITTGTKRVRSYDLATGKVLWEGEGLTVNCIPSPMVLDDRAIVMSGYRGAKARAVKLDARGDVTGTKDVVWQHEKGTPYVPSAVLAGERLYFTHFNDPVLSCLDARTGTVIFEGRRLPLRSLYGSPVAVAGRLYFVDRDGTGVVLQQGDSVKVLAINRLEEPVDASPVVLGDVLLLRGEKNLYCIAE
jgi:outer membrane protein assembly factor BamB